MEMLGSACPSHVMKLETKAVALTGISFVAGFFFCAVVLNSFLRTKPVQKVLLEGPALVSAAPAAKIPAPVPILADLWSQQPITFGQVAPPEGQVWRVPPQEQVWDMSRNPTPAT